MYKIVNYLTKGKSKSPANFKRRGFASMSKEKQTEIASRGGKTAWKKGTAHRWTSEEARRAGTIGGLKPGTNRRVYVMNINSVRSKLLNILQNLYKEHPDKPISFAALGKELSSSRQNIRTLYYLIKKDHPVSPVAKRGIQRI